MTALFNVLRRPLRPRGHGPGSGGDPQSAMVVPLQRAVVRAGRKLDADDHVVGGSSRRGCTWLLRTAAVPAAKVANRRVRGSTSRCRARRKRRPSSPPVKISRRRRQSDVARPRPPARPSRSARPVGRHCRVRPRPPSSPFSGGTKRLHGVPTIDVGRRPSSRSRSHSGRVSCCCRGWPDAASWSRVVVVRHAEDRRGRDARNRRQARTRRARAEPH